MSNAAKLITQALHNIVCQPDHDEARIRSYFSPDYQQQVNGEALDFAGFVRHMAKLKQLTRSIDITVVAIASQHNEVLTRHHVSVEKKDGAQSHIEVFAHFTLREGLIIRCEELTRLLDGAAEDHSLGSVR